MAVTFSWYDESKTILHCRLQDRWTWAEFHERLTSDAFTLINSVSHPMVTMYTTNTPDYLPAGTLTQIMSINRMGIPPHFRGTYLVGVSLFTQSIISALGRVNIHVAQRYIFAPDLETALTMIEKRLKEEDSVDP